MTAICELCSSLTVFRVPQVSGAVIDLDVSASPSPGDGLRLDSRLHLLYAFTLTSRRLCNDEMRVKRVLSVMKST